MLSIRHVALCGTYFSALCIPVKMKTLYETARCDPLTPIFSLVTVPKLNSIIFFSWEQDHEILSDDCCSVFVSTSNEDHTG